jgi:rubrerythrin
MTIEEAIKTAIEYEIKVRDAYLGNLDAIKDSAGRRVFQVLGDEEQGHVDYLEACLAEWQRTGRVSDKELATVVPSGTTIEAGMQALGQHLQERDFGSEIRMLEKALEMEQETSAFYGRMVNEMDEGRELFQRFLEIEEGHQTIVLAELDYLGRTGSFFDFQEFTMED